MKLITALLIFSSQLGAAPYPVTGSSVFLTSKKNYYLNPFAIYLNLEKSDYFVDLSQDDTDKWTIRKSSSPILITMRFRKFNTDAEYEKSLKNWVKEYQKSGLQLVQKQIGDRRPQKGWIHLQDTTGQQILQYFSYLSQDKIWVFFNCIGKKEEFETLFANCEQLNSRLDIRDLQHK